MEDNEEEVRKTKQRNALEVYGARIDTTYLTRKSEVIAVNRNDLSEIMQFDGTEFYLCAVGQFFLAGGTWIFIDRYFSDKFIWNAFSGFCLASAIFGAFLWLAGYQIRSIKQKKISRIFEEIEPQK